MSTCAIAAGLAISLSGCAAGMAVSAIGLAARSARGEPKSNQHLRPEAVQACTARAAQHGEVKIIDVERRPPARLIVWGTVTDPQAHRSFQCAYGTRITSFKLREIRSGS